MAGCMEFYRDGSSKYINVTNYFSPHNTEGTIAAWVNLSANDLPSNTIWHNNGGQFMIRPRSTGVLESGVLGTSTNRLIGSTTLDVGTWYFVSVTWDSGGSAHLYLDFSLEDSGSGTRVNNSGDHRIGGKSVASNNMVGKISHVQHWSRVLSTDEMRQAASRPGSVAQGLELHLTMRDGVANTQTDRSGNGRSGTVNNSPNDLDEGPPSAT